MKHVMEVNKNMNQPRGTPWFIFLLSSITFFIVTSNSQWNTLWKSTEIWISLEAPRDSYFCWLCRWFQDANAILILHRGTIGKVNGNMNHWVLQGGSIFSLTLPMVPWCKINIDLLFHDAKSILILHRGTISKVNENMNHWVPQGWFRCSLTLPMVPRCNINMDFASWNHWQSQRKYESLDASRLIHICVDFADGSTMQNQYWCCTVEPLAKSTKIWIVRCFKADSYFPWLCRWFHDAQSILMLHCGTIGEVNEHMNRWVLQGWFILYFFIYSSLL
jgi:hypothetical protein